MNRAHPFPVLLVDDNEAQIMWAGAMEGQS